MSNPSRLRTSVECRMEWFIVAVILLASVKVADAQFSVVCCLPNGTCAVREFLTCRAQGGVPVPHATTCAFVVCTGACCAPNGACAVVTPQTCTDVSGTFDSFGSLCADVVCAGACCRANGSCARSNEASCTSPNTFNGLGSECVTSICTGACCLPDKSCTQTGPSGCASVDGLFQGLGTICGDECPVAMPTSFTYQGQLKRAGVPLNGPIDARFSLWLNSTDQGPEHQIGSALALDSVEVANGLFSVELDFGQNAFNGNARWLQIEVHDHADPPDTFATLSPRQPLTPSPYSLETRGIVVRDNGNVGIGTKTPTSKLEIAAQDGLAITGPQPFLTLRDTNGGGAVTIGNSGGLVGIGTTAPVGGLHVRHEPGASGGTLALEGSTYTYLGLFPQGVAAGRKAWLGFGAPGTTELTLGNETGGDINLVTLGNVRAEDVVVTGKIDIGYEIVLGAGTGHFAVAQCPTGKRVIGAGCDCGLDRVLTSIPFNGGTEWLCQCDGDSTDAYAICAQVK